MKFGLSFLPDATEEKKGAPQYYKEILALCEIADQAKFTSVKMTEHYLHSYGGYCPSPLMFLSSVAARTKDIRLMTGCILPSFHHPIQIASHVAMLDAMSSGRVDVGFARAYLPYEFDAFKIPLDQSTERFRQTVMAAERLWQEKEVSLHTPYFSFDKATIQPSIVQSPSPPIWCAAVYTIDSYRWIAERGYNLLVTPPLGDPETFLERITLYRKTFAQNHPGKEAIIAMSLPIFANKESKKAHDEAEHCLQHYLDIWRDAASYWRSRFSNDYMGYSYLEYALAAQTPTLMLKNNRALAGTPEEITEKIISIYEQFGIDYFLLQIDTGSQPYCTSFRTLELFANDIMPELEGISLQKVKTNG